MHCCCLAELGLAYSCRDTTTDESKDIDFVLLLAFALLRLESINLDNYTRRTPLLCYERTSTQRYYCSHYQYLRQPTTEWAQTQSLRATSSDYPSRRSAHVEALSPRRVSSLRLPLSQLPPRPSLSVERTTAPREPLPLSRHPSTTRTPPSPSKRCVPENMVAFCKGWLCMRCSQKVPTVC